MSAASSAATATKTTGLVLGGASLIGVGIAAGMWLSRPALVAPASVPTTEASASAVVGTPMVAAPASAPASAITAEQTSTPVTAAPEPVTTNPVAKAEPKPIRKNAPAKETSATASADKPEPTPAPVPAICQTCGTVTHVNAIQQEVETSGVGAVAGGVIGGALGNQIGKGKGRTAMTILGAIGGGMAGNEIEKRKRAVTVYEVTVRMDNGATEIVTVETPPSTGGRVEVKGNSLMPL